MHIVFQDVHSKTMDKKISSTSQPRILKKKHFRVKHQKVKLFRANEPILSVFMWGINHTVSTYVCVYPFGMQLA